MHEQLSAQVSGQDEDSRAVIKQLREEQRLLVRERDMAIAELERVKQESLHNHEVVTEQSSITLSSFDSERKSVSRESLVSVHWSESPFRILCQNRS